MTDLITPHNRGEMLDACLAQHEHLSSSAFGYGPTWEGDCQAFVHCMWGVLVGGFGSAYLQWLGLDPEDRHPASDLGSAPLGASLFTKGVTPFGHTFPKARPFPSGVQAGWSTDLWRTGLVGKVPVTAPMTEWGHRPLGWGTSVNGYALDLTGQNPPKPKQNKRYQRIQNAINNLEAAKDAARHDHDQRDLDALNKEIKRLQDLYSKIRHS